MCGGVVVIWSIAGNPRSLGLLSELLLFEHEDDDSELFIVSEHDDDSELFVVSEP